MEKITISILKLPFADMFLKFPHGFSTVFRHPGPNPPGPPTPLSTSASRSGAGSSEGGERRRLLLGMRPKRWCPRVKIIRKLEENGDFMGFIADL